MSRDLDSLIAQAAEAREKVRGAQLVADAAKGILNDALKREGEANRALYDEVDNQVRGSEVAG